MSYWQYFTHPRIVGPTAVFARLPQSRLLTLNMDTPDRWLITPVIAKYDLDNLKLEDINERLVFAQYELQHIMVEGSDDP